MKTTEIVRKIAACALILLTFWTPVALAQAVSFEANAPISVAPNQRFQVTFTLSNAQGADFQAPEFSGLKVLMGPMVSNQSSFNSVNGVTTSSTAEVYTYYVEADGTQDVATVGPAKITANSKKYTSKTLKINTRGGGASGQNSGTAGQSKSARKASGGSVLRLEFDKTSVYKGEAIAAELVLYSNGDIAAIDGLQLPSFKGFWAVDVDVPQSPTGERRTLGGEVYQAYPLRRWLLYPQQSGTLEVELASLQATAQHIVQAGNQTIYDQFFGGGQSVTQVPVQLKTTPRKVTVKPLPAGGPIGIPVAVGDFTLGAQLSTQQLEVNRAATLRVTLSGSGDFPIIETPAFPLPAEFEGYEVKTIDTLRNTLSGGTKGVRVWEFPFVARSEGEYVLPAVEVAFFNPKTQKYTTLKTPEYPMNVRRAAGSGGNATSALSNLAGVSKEELKILGQDIRYIAMSPPLMAAEPLLRLHSWQFVLLILLAAIVAGVAIFVLRTRAKNSENTPRNRQRGANKMAVRRLKKARRELVAMNPERFYTEVLGAVWGFMSDRFGLQVAELSKEKIRTELDQRGINTSVAEGFIEILEECEMAKYGLGAAAGGSGDVREGMQRLYDRALGLLF